MPQGLGHFLFLVFCLLCAFRDVIAESFLKLPQGAIAPMNALFIYSLTTQIAAFLFDRKNILRINLKEGADFPKKLFFLVNVFTFISFLTYFLAIQSPLGSGINALVTYGMDPIFTSLTGYYFLKESMKRNFWPTAVLCLLGIVILNLSQLSAFPKDWFLGLFFSLISTFTFAGYLLCMKKLLSVGIKKTTLVFYRLILTTIMGAILTCLYPPSLNLVLLGKMIAAGFFTFALPFYMFTFIIEKFTLVNLGILMFVIPVFTLLLSAVFGMHHLTFTDILATTVIGAAVFLFERSK